MIDNRLHLKARCRAKPIGWAHGTICLAQTSLMLQPFPQFACERKCQPITKNVVIRLRSQSPSKAIHHTIYGRFVTSQWTNNWF
ncbi:MAG: hypothetical protein D6694_10360 [Gammaproteobacteria bacterium]|nr:MAG: hypothetical protein D6694_10360 [Gammaproteobacteria bacterium]